MDNPANDHGGPATAAPWKTSLRTRIRAERARFGAHVIGVPSEYVVLLAPEMTVASYIAIGNEADPSSLARAALRAGCRIALPHVVDRATPLRFLAWDPVETLHIGPFGLSQPRREAEAVEPDLILTPLVAFDAALNRIGQGAGHYDRAFATFPSAKRIGVAYSIQQVPPFSPDPWDLPLDAIVTEQRWITR